MNLDASFDVLEGVSKLIFILDGYLSFSSTLLMSLFKIVRNFKLLPAPYLPPGLFAK